MDEITKKKVLAHYQKGEGSIQDIARVYKIEVSEILDLIGASELKTVTIGGDTIGAEEAGSGAKMNYGEEKEIRYTTN
jgi:hypothetical protein